MATTTATITLSSTDLLSDELALSTTSTLTQAGNSTGIISTSGLSRTNFLSTDPASRSNIIYRAEDATTGGASSAR